MPDVQLTLAFSSFIAGVLMFFAPCTLPIIPAYIAFISGIKEKDARLNNRFSLVIFKNALFFVLGFSFIFIFFGVLAGYIGSYSGAYKVLLSQLGGVIIIFFGLTLLHFFEIPFLKNKYSFTIPRTITPGNTKSAFLMGSIFALGWTPCIGPILASVLLIASISATALYGAMLLTLFSIGLSIPFLLTAILYARMSDSISKFGSAALFVQILGALFLIVIGALLATNNFNLTLHYGANLFEFLHIESVFKFY